jgi:arylsulfatase A-like enzyme
VTPAARALSGVLGLLGLPALLGACGERAPERPDVVLVLVDTLRADYLGCYGFEGDVSPRLDALAREGVVFERCFSQAPWTKPSVASLLTSLPPEIHRVTTHEGWFGERAQDGGVPAPVRRTEVLPEEARTLAEALRDQGFGQGFETFEEVESKDGADILTRALSWLAAREDRRPLFLYLHFMDVHGPYASGDAGDADYAAVGTSPSLGEPRAIEGRDWRRIPGYLRQVPWFETPEARERRTWRGRYAAGVRAFDRHRGELVDELARTGRLDRTLLAVTSDHGEELLERDLWDHGEALFDQELHVPLVLRLPGKARAGERVEDVVSTIDVAPTLLGALGVPAASDWMGRDLARLAPGGRDAGAFSVASAVKWRPKLFSLRTARHKLVCDLERGTFEVFDLASDPLEQTDLAERDAELARELRATFEGYVATLARTPALEPGETELSQELVERLKALGY